MDIPSPSLYPLTLSRCSHPLHTQIDWAPYMLTHDPTAAVVNSSAQNITRRETFGFGIWKSVYLVPLSVHTEKHDRKVPTTANTGHHTKPSTNKLTPSSSGATAAIMQFVPHTFYAGGHPIRILSDDEHAGFEVRSRVVLWAPAPTNGTVTISIAPHPTNTSTRTCLLSHYFLTPLPPYHNGSDPRLCDACSKTFA